MDHYDAIVIGAGTSGLAAGAMLAQAGKRVVVIERAARAGGAHFTERRDGFLLSNEGFSSRLIEPKILEALNLGRHGLKLLPVRVAYGVNATGEVVVLPADPLVAIHSLGGRDGERLCELLAYVRRQIRSASELDNVVPTKPTLFGPKRGGLIAAYQALSAIGQPGTEELLRFWSSSLGDLLDEYLASDTLKAMIALRSLIGTGLSPFSPGTASRLLAHPLFSGDEVPGFGDIPAGGGSEVASALASALRDFGGELRLSTKVTAVLLENGNAAGVVLESGDEIRADAVLSSLDVKQTFTTLLDADSVPKPFMGRLAATQSTGATARVDLSLDELPDFPSLPDDWINYPGDLAVVSSLRELESAHRRWLSGQLLDEPPIILSVPTLIDRSRAPPRHHVLSISVHLVPASLADGPWTAERRQNFVARIFDLVKRVSPGLMDRIRDMRLLMPSDIEAEAGITDGGGESWRNPPLAQILGRGVTEYQTPVPGLFMCDAQQSAVAGSGADAAGAVLAALKGKGR